MLVKLTLENYLAHGRTVIELGPGLTVLVGPNNSGKSAVVEGLRCLATNPAPKHFIRHGAKLARVEAEFSDGTRVAWLRKEKSAGYELYRPGADAPEEFWKLQGKVPQEVQDVLRLNLVQLEAVNRSLDVHLGNQKEPIFLLNEPPSAMAAFFASSSESAHLLGMQKALQTKVRESKADERKTRGRLTELERVLRTLTPLPDLRLRLDAARERHEEIRKAEARLPELARTAEGLRRLELSRNVLRRRVEIQSRLTQAPQLWPAARLAEALTLRARLAAGKLLAERRRQALTPLTEPPLLFPAERLAKHLENQALRQGALVKVSRRREVLEPLREPPQLFDALRLDRWIKERRRLEARMTGLEVRAGRAANLLPPPEPVRTQGLSEAARTLRELKRQAEAMHARLGRNDEALAACEARIAARLAQIGSCPLCGGGMDAEAFLRRQGCKHAEGATCGGQHG